MLYQVKSRIKSTLVVLLSLACFTSTNAQQSEWKDSLEYFEKEDSLNAYIDFVYSKYLELKVIYKADSLYQKALELYEENPLFRKPKTDEEKYRTRKYISFLTYFYYKVNGKDDIYLETLLKAQEYATDKVLLDNYAWSIEFQIGHFYAAQNDYDKALQYYRNIIPGLKHRKNYKRVSRVLTDMGNAYLWSGDKYKALVVMKEAEAMAITTEDDKSLRAATTKLRSYFLDVLDTINFKKYYLKSIKIIGEVESYDRELYKSINAQEYSKYLEISNEHDKALEYLYDADSLLNLMYTNKNRREFAKNDLAIANVLFDKGDVKASLGRIEIGYQRLLSSYEIDTQSFPNPQQIYNENTLMDLLKLQSKGYKELYDSSRNSKYLDSISITLELAILSAEILKDEMLYTNSKVKSTSAIRYLINDAVDNLFAKQEYGTIIDRDIRSLRTLINKSKNSLLATQIELNSKIQKLPSREKSRVDSLQKIIATNITERGYENANRDSFNADIFRIKEIIDFKTKDKFSELNVIESKNYIEYFEGDSSIYIISDIEGKHIFKRLGSMKEFNFHLSLLNRQMNPNSSIDSVNFVLSRLSSFLIPDTISLPDDLTIIVDGLTSVVPFDALRKEGRYLIENKRITLRYHYLYRGSNDISTYEKLYCLAPIYTSKGKVSSSRGGLYHLPFAQEEVSLIEDAMGFQSVIHPNEDLNSLVKNLVDADIFHFAGHAIAEGDNAYLVLTSDTTTHKFTFEQILNQSIDVDLVTLSACETGLGSLQYGDGLNSICRSFLGAGAKDVIYSLWVVNDVSTSSLMHEVYTYLKEGLSPEKSLRSAKLVFYNSCAPQFRHPYYWAGFATTGTTIIFNNQQWPSYKYLLLLLIPILLYLKPKTK